MWISLISATFANTSSETVEYFCKRAPLLKEVFLKGRRATPYPFSYMRLTKGDRSWMKLGVTSHGQLRLVVLDEGVSTSQVRINWEGNYQEIVLP